MYKSRRWKYGNCIEVKESHTARCGAPGQPREKKTRPTPEAVRKQNQRRKEEQASRIVAANFEEGDLVRTLTFRKENRPKSMEEAQAVFKRFYERLRKEYRKRFYDLYWIASIENTPGGAWHIHFICNKIFGASDIIKELWDGNGGVFDQTLKDLQGRDIGKYMAKTPASTEKGEHRVTEAKLTHSRNLTIPKPEEKIITGWKMTDEPRPPKGYYLVKDSVYEGVNADGYPYRGYKFKRLTPLEPKSRRWKPPGKKKR